MKGIVQITDKIDRSELGNFSTKKLEGQIIRKSLNFPGADVYLIKPEVYRNWKTNGKLSNDFSSELDAPIKNLINKYKLITIRTCFWFRGFENPRALPSWRNLKDKKDVLKSIEEAYKSGEVIARDNKIGEYELGLLIQGRLDAEKGGFAVADIEKEKLCMIDSCWGDAHLIAMGGEDFDTYWVDENGKIIEKIIRNKRVGHFYVKTQKKALKIKGNRQIMSSLTDNEVIEISKHIFRSAKKINYNVEAEFLITKNGIIDIYELQMKPGFTIFKPQESLTEKNVIVKGLGAYPGKVRGRVRIIKNRSDFKKIEDGDIAVVDKKMMAIELPLLTKVAAIITTTGGITSHFATVTKEFKIPCIVGAHNATKILKNNQEIFVDATRGEVYSRMPEIDELGEDSSVVWFAESTKKIDLIGNKALNLINMMQLGLPVPPGFIITTKSLSEFLKENKIDKEMNKMLANMNFGKLENMEEKVKLLFNKSKIHKSLEKNIVDSFDKLKQKYHRVSVRSSATCEDSVKASFAGQFQSFLFVSDKNNLLKSIKNCWASAYRPGVFIYANRLGINPKNIKMAVVVQGMIEGEKAGVIFTKNIWEGEKDTILIESSEGIGENVVSGLKTPSRYVIDKKSSKILHKSEKRGDSLSTGEISELIKYAKILEDYYGHPQDIEWAIKDGKIYLLQSRPITA